MNDRRLRGLDLFSGYGGITLALAPWVRPIAYCEQDRYCQSLLLSRMAYGHLPVAPIWDDVKSLKGDQLPAIGIIYGGFPCQDISVAGSGRGLSGERSGLFTQIVRLAQEIQPQFLFLENVPAIRTRGLSTIVRELARIGYDSRWCTLSAAQVGAPHRRERWFLLAHANGDILRDQQGWGSGKIREGQAFPDDNGQNEHMAYADSPGLSEQTPARSEENTQGCGEDHRGPVSSPFERGWWSAEPDVGRVANGTSYRMDRIKCLGNGVVPIQARTAFKYLMGIQ